MVEKLTGEIHTLSFTLSTKMLFMFCQCSTMDGYHAFRECLFTMAHSIKDLTSFSHLCLSVGILASTLLTQKTDSYMILAFTKSGSKINALTTSCSGNGIPTQSGRA